MEFFVQIGLTFSNMTWPVILCLIAGLIFMLIEVFQPGFGVFGITGLILSVLGIVLRVVFRKPEDNALAQVFILLFILTIIIIAGFIIMVRSAKMGWLSRSPFIQNSTAVSSEISEGTMNYTDLLDKVGIAATDLRPVGKVNIDGKIYDAQTESFYISKGEGIKVSYVEGGKVTVRIVE